MGWGDEIVAAGQAQTMYDALGLCVAIQGLDGKRRWHPIWEGNPVIARPDEPFERGQFLLNGPNCRPYIVYPFTKESGWTFNKAFRCRDHVAKLYLTPQERAIGQRAKDEYGPYVLIEPHTKHDNFRWPMDRWAALVKACPGTTFIQHTHHDSPGLVPGAIEIAASFREACGLVASCDVYVRSESGMCHAAAALVIPQVTIFGGCMDPEVMAYYPGQTVIADTGAGSPCGRWLPCAHCSAVMDRITVDAVVTAMRDAMRAREAA